MRAGFFKALSAVQEHNQHCWLVTDEFALPEVAALMERDPKRVISAGVTGATAIGVAGGLAASGKLVFVYFPSAQPLLDGLGNLRADVCVHHADVKIVVGAAPLDGGLLGTAHTCAEDLGLARLLPNMSVFAPADPAECELLTAELSRQAGPAYMRLGQSVAVHSGLRTIEVGRALQLREGADMTLIAIGSMLSIGMRVAAVMARLGLDCRVLSMPTLRPLDQEAVDRAADETGAIVTLEEHSVEGGLGSAVAEVLAARGYAVPLQRIGLPAGQIIDTIGQRAFLVERSGLTPSGVLDALKDVVRVVEREKRTWSG